MNRPAWVLALGLCAAMTAAAQQPSAGAETAGNAPAATTAPDRAAAAPGDSPGLPAAAEASNPVLPSIEAAYLENKQLHCTGLSGLALESCRARAAATAAAPQGRPVRDSISESAGDAESQPGADHPR